MSTIGYPIPNGSLEHIHTSHIIQTEQGLYFRNVCVYVCVNSEKRGHEFERIRKDIYEEREWEMIYIIISKDK